VASSSGVPKRVAGILVLDADLDQVLMEVQVVVAEAALCQQPFPFLDSLGRRA